MSSDKRLLLFSVLVVTAAFGLAQERYELLKQRFPTSVMDYKAFDEPQIDKVKVNGKDEYSLSGFYEIDLDNSFSIRLTDYTDEPDFITKMVSQFKASQPYEDESEKLENYEIQNHPTQFQVLKKYPSYNITTLITDKDRPWLLTFSGNGMGEEQAKIIMQSLVETLVQEN